VDTSASMTGLGMSKRSTMTPLKAAALFGVALAAKGERVDLHGFATGVFRHEIPAGASVIDQVARFCGRVGRSVTAPTSPTRSGRRTPATTGCS
jgi:hypothetical protein